MVHRWRRNIFCNFGTCTWSVSASIWIGKRGKKVADLDSPKCVRCGKIGILSNGQLHVGLNVSSTLSWKQEMVPSLSHLFWTDETKNVVSEHESLSVASPSAEKMLGHSLSILVYKRWCLLTEKGQSDISTHQTDIWNKVSTPWQKNFSPQRYY